MLKILEFRSLGFFEINCFRLSRRRWGISRKEKKITLKIQRREKMSQNLFQTFVQTFCNKDSKPPIKEGRRGEKRKRRRIIILKISLGGFLLEATSKIHMTKIHHPPQ
jgi:hypothetical protein